jgi:hypothetical protein
LFLMWAARETRIFGREVSSLLCAAALVASGVLTGGDLNAQPSNTSAQASSAYDRGTKAYARGDYATAATEYARADELAPNPVALESALKAAVWADAPALGMELVERSARAPMGGSLAALVKLARERFATRAGQIIVACPVGATCQATVDDSSTPVDKLRWVSAGTHQVDLHVNGSAEHRSVVVGAGTVAEVKSQAAPAPAAPSVSARPYPDSTPLGRASSSGSRKTESPSSATSGVSPAWFWGFGGLTVIVGGFTVASALDAQKKYDDWQNDRTAPAKSDAQNGAVRTNILLGALAVCAVTTAAIGIFAVRWSSAPQRAALRPATISF